MSIKSVLQPNKPLPSNLVNNFVDLHLYRIGLSLFPNEFIKRTRIHNPKFIFIIQLLFFIRSIIALLSSREDTQFYAYIGDFAYFINAKAHIGTAAAFASFPSIVSQIIHYFNYKNDIKPSYLKPFEMLSGLVSPKSIGVKYRREDVYKMVKMWKILFLFLKSVNYLTFFAAFMIALVTFIQCLPTKQFLIFRFLHIIHWGINCYYVYSILISEIVFF